METEQAAQKEQTPSGIPHAPFVADVEQYLGGPDVEVEPTLRRFQDALAKYRYMEHNLTQRRQALEEKIPDIKKTLKMVEYLQERREGRRPSSEDDDLDEEVSSSNSQPVKATFELNDTLYAEAVLEEMDTVYLWLGANVMLSYTIPEAIELLSSKLGNAEQNLTTLISALEYLKEQVTIMEVNTARVYNWDVKRRREKKEREAGLASKG